MALTCDAPTLSSAANDLYQKLTQKQILAALLYIQCTLNNMNCTPASLAAASECLRCSMTEKGLLAALLYVQCTNNGGSGGGGGGGGTIQVYENRAPANPDDPTKAALSFATGGGGLSEWVPSSQSWV